MANGEIGVSASSGGRRITMDPLAEREVQVKVRRVESGLPAGFQVPWVEATLDDGRRLDMSVGAGVGSRWLLFHVGPEGTPQSVVLAIDAEDLVRPMLAWAEEVLAEPPAGGEQA